MNHKTILASIAGVALGYLGLGTARNTGQTILSDADSHITQPTPASRQYADQLALLQQEARQSQMQRSTPSRAPRSQWHDGGIPPKVYGTYLLRSGQWRRNALRRRLRMMHQ